jgi:hypothetical protein
MVNRIYAQDLTHKLYGYSQLDYKTTNDPRLEEGFRFTRINLINDFSLQSNARFVADLEYEDGTDISSKTTKGSVKVSRGFFEYNINSNTSVTMGKILTSFGLLNETHDFSITYLPIEVPLPYRPYIINGTNETRIFSKYSTGISFANSNKILNKYKWTNQFTIANGFRETLKGTDSNHDKALSLKSSLKYLENENTYEAGASVYTERDSSPFGGSYTRRFWTNAVHFKFENDSYNFSSEVFYSKFNSAIRNYQETLSYYACLGYTLSERLTPYLLYSKAVRDLSDQNSYDKDLVLGVNTNLLQQVIMKIEYTFTEREVVDRSKIYKTLATNLTVAF